MQDREANGPRGAITPLYAALGYGVFSSLWILFSGYLVAFAVGDDQLRHQVEVIKGLAFVVFTSLLLYFFLRQQYRHFNTESDYITVGNGNQLVGIAVVLMLLVPLVGYGILRIAIPAEEKAVLGSLESIVNLQADSIRIWHSEREKDIAAVSRAPHFLELAETLQQRPNDPAVQEQLKAELRPVLVAYGYIGISVIGVDGTPLLTLGEKPRWQPESGKLPPPEAAQDRAWSGEMFLTESNEPRMEFIAPILNGSNSGQIQGYLVFQSSPANQVFNSIGQRPERFQTLKSMLLKIDNGIISSIQLVQEKDSYTDRVQIYPVWNQTTADLVINPRAGVMSATTRDGTDVLTVYRPDSSTGWNLVSRVHRGEALEPVRELAAWISLIAFVAVTTIAVIVLMLWRQQRRSYALSIVAQRARHEQYLREQEAVYREMFEANPNPMLVYEANTLRILAVNKSALELYGYSSAELLAMTVRDLVPGEDQPDVDLLFNSRFHREEQTPGYWRHRKKDGSEILVETRAHSLIFEGLKARLVLAFDVTEREQTKLQIIESERLAKATIDALSTSIAVLEHDGTIVTTNQAWRTFALANYDHPELVESGGNFFTFSEQTAPFISEGDKVIAGLREVMSRQRNEFHMEFSYDAPSGLVWFASRMTRFQGEGQTGSVVAFQDITARKLAEENLRTLNRHYAALSAMNSAIFALEDPEKLLETACRIAAEQVELELVVAGKISNAGYEFLAHHGPASGVLDELPSLGNDAITPATVALMRKRTVVVNDFRDSYAKADWTSTAEHWNLRSMLACPILGREKVRGFLVFLSSQTHYFNPQLTDLLEKLTADLAHSLDNLEIKRQKRKTEEELLRNAKIIESSQEGIYITDARFRITMANKAFCDVTGFSREELLGADYSLIDAGLDSKENWVRCIDELKKTGSWQGEVWNRRKNGEIYPAWLSITGVTEAASTYYIVVYRDITARKEYENRIEYIASHDTLTDLPNRVVLGEMVNNAIARADRHGGQLALLFIDLDRFKLINDTLGHDIGDELLKIAAQRIVGVLRKSDAASRIGGDEFIVLLSEIRSPEDAALVAEKIIEAIGGPCHIGNYQLVVTGSVGIATYPENGQNFEELAKMADLAMISAKHSGQDRYQFYSGEQGTNAREYLNTLNELRGAIPRGELHLAYQPQLNLATRQLVGLEALSRWHHPVYGNIPPSRFIPIAEDSGLIIQLGAWALQEACSQARVWREQGLLHAPVSVNVSALQFRQNDFVETIHAVLESTGLPPSGLELEVTESALMRDVDDVIKKLHQLRALGISLAIDDFGTGYSSLSYLRQFSAQRLKIDKTFISDLPHNSDAAAIARSIVSLGSTLHMEVIAEGIETCEQAEFLKSISCQRGQGYYYAKPMNSLETESWLCQPRVGQRL